VKSVSKKPKSESEYVALCSSTNATVDEYALCSEHWPDTDEEVRDLKTRIKRGDYLEVEGVRDSMDVLREHVSERPAMYLGNFDDLQTGYDLTDKQVDELRRLSMQLLDDGSE